LKARLSWLGYVVVFSTIILNCNAPVSTEIKMQTDIAEFNLSLAKTSQMKWRTYN
jgi:hypothetical protein